MKADTPKTLAGFLIIVMPNTLFSVGQAGNQIGAALARYSGPFFGQDVASASDEPSSVYGPADGHALLSRKHVSSARASGYVFVDSEPKVCCVIFVSKERKVGECIRIGCVKLVYSFRSSAACLFSSRS